GRSVSVPGCQLYLGDLMRESGSPADPLERMLLEQLVLAHHTIGQLHVRAGTSQTAEAAGAYAGAAARLLAELRRTALAPAPSRAATAPGRAAAAAAGGHTAARRPRRRWAASRAAAAASARRASSLRPSATRQPTSQAPSPRRRVWTTSNWNTPTRGVSSRA